MLPFEKITLQPMSWKVLQNLYNAEPRPSEKIAEEVGLSKRQVDAVVTRTLVRLGFCIRTAKLTRLMKKEYNLISVTKEGNQYIEWRYKNQTPDQNQGQK